MKVVKVYGKLRQWLGGQCRFELDVDTPAQALKALCVNFPGLDRWLIDSEQDGLGYRVTVGRERITNDHADRLVLPWSDREVFSICPVIAGAGGPVGRILAGVALVAFSLLLPGVGAAIGGALMTKIGLIGGSLILTGVAQLISPTQDLGSLTQGQEAVRLESFTFSGIVNTSKQGLPVPIAYGRVFVGSAVVSPGLDTDQL
jgi:Phage-related protein, tail component